jgi:enoyl-CoA hydratase/carnithine racemase
VTDSILYEVNNRIAWITINRPEARNAMNRAVREGLREGFAAAEADSSVDVVVLTGSGEKAFCAGGDLAEMSTAKLTVPPPDYVPQPGRTMEMTKPLIAAVNGLALGGGFLLAQTADLIVAAKHATFGITEIKIGRGAPWAAPLPWLIPPRIAMQMLTTGDTLTAQRAYEVGLVNYVVSSQDLHTRTKELATTIASNAPLSVRAGKATVYAAAHYNRDEAFAVAENIWKEVYFSQDAQEGMQAFTERRKPVWTGQ